MGSVQSGRRNNIEGELRRDREEVFTYAAFFVSSYCVKIATKMAA